MEETEMLNAVFIKTEFHYDEDSQEIKFESASESARTDNNRQSINTFITSTECDMENIKLVNEESSSEDIIIKDNENVPIDIPALRVESEKTRETIIKCCICLKTFAHLSVLKTHISKHFKVKVLCLICDRTISNEDKLTTHMKTHFEERKFVCQSCGRTFKRSAYLHRHEVGCGGGKQSSEHLCTICGKLCQSKWQLQQHTMFHSDERPFPCAYCSKSFRFKARLSEHERTHLGIKPHVCDICEKTFTTSSDLRKHERRHEKPGFKSYNTENNPNKLSVCKVCNVKVVNLKNHLQLHYEQGSGTCNICGKMLKMKSLYQHLKTHSEGALYECDVCSRKFNRKDNMLSHKERHAKETYKPKASSKLT